MGSNYKKGVESGFKIFVLGLKTNSKEWDQSKKGMEIGFQIFALGSKFQVIRPLSKNFSSEQKYELYSL